MIIKNLDKQNHSVTLQDKYANVLVQRGKSREPDRRLYKLFIYCKSPYLINNHKLTATANIIKTRNGIDAYDTTSEKHKHYSRFVGMAEEEAINLSTFYALKMVEKFLDK